MEEAILRLGTATGWGGLASLFKSQYFGGSPCQSNFTSTNIDFHNRLGGRY